MITICAVIAAIAIAYWGLWTFYFRDHPTDPFAPNPSYVRHVDEAFKPIRDLEEAKYEQRVREETRESIQGEWVTSAGTAAGVRVHLTVNGDTLTFTDAATLPELSGRQFTLQDHGIWTTYHIVTPLGRIIVESPVQQARRGRTGTSIVLKGEFSGRGDEELVFRAHNKANKSE